MRRCKHDSLMSTDDIDVHKVYKCEDCNGNCKFCGICSNPFTDKTINKYKGICGSCFSAYKKDREESEEDSCDEDSEDLNFTFPLTNGIGPLGNGMSGGIKNIPGMGPMMIIIQPLTEMGEDECDSDEMNCPVGMLPPRLVPPKSKGFSPSSMYPMGIEQTGKFVVKNILAKDDNTKKALVEWGDERVATWETYLDLKGNKIFQAFMKK